MRLIDLDKIKPMDFPSTEMDGLDVVRYLNTLPTVDAVEVVRCEKCLYRSQYCDENGLYKCGGLQTEDGDLVLMVKPDFFCAFGERRGAKMDGDGNE